MEWIVLFITLAAAQQCHPNCTCNGTLVGPPACVPVCVQPRCQRCFNASGTPQCESVYGACNVTCPSGQCEATECPACETLCPPLCGNTSACFTQCDEAQCAWSCNNSYNCTDGEQVQCDAPACEASGSSQHAVALTMMMAGLLLSTQ